MSANAMICERCGGNIVYNPNTGKFICASCDTEYILSQDDGFNIVADVLKDYTGRSSSVVIPEGVREIDEDAFYGLRIVEIVLPSTLKVFNTNILSHCPDIKKVIIPEGIEAITGSPNCHGLNVGELEIPKSVEKIYYNPFHNYGIKTLKIHHDMDYYFKEYDYRTHGIERWRQEADKNLARFPWEWDDLETVITPTETIDYKKFSKERHDKYLAVEKEIEETRKKAQEELRIEQEKQKQQEEMQRKQEEEMRIKAEKRRSNAAMWSWIIFVLSILFLPFPYFNMLLILLGAIITYTCDGVKALPVISMILWLVFKPFA